MEPWDLPTYTRTRRQALPQALVLLLSLCVTTTAAAGASAVRCSVRTFLWLSVASILALGATLAVVHTSSRARQGVSRWLQRLESLPALLYASAGALALGLGSFGLAAVASQSTASNADAKDAPPQWVLTMATAIAVAWTVAAAALVVMALLTALRRIQPGQEAPPAILMLRCSCCSAAVKRLVMVLPFATLATLSLVLWRQATASGNGCELAQQLTRLLQGAVAVFGSMVATLAVVSVYQWVTRSMESTLKSRRRLHAATLLLLLTFGTVAVAWAATCCVWLRSNKSLVVSTSNTELCSHIEESYRSVQLMTVALFTVGAVLLSVTCCCRLERHLLRDMASTPSVDLSMLSPHAIRPPAHTKSPTDQAV